MKFFNDFMYEEIPVVLGFNNESVERECTSTWVVKFTNREFRYWTKTMYNNRIFQDKDGQWKDKEGNKYVDVATDLSLPQVILVKEENMDKLKKSEEMEKMIISNEEFFMED